MTIEITDIDTIAKGAANRRPTLSLDVAAYDSYLSDSALSEADKRALLEALWAIIVGFVDLGFAVEPSAPADKSGDGGGEFASAGFAAAQSSSNSTTDHFEKAAARTAPPGH
ncbi:hypothetical protein [Bosea sp. (in: a-proteobacteria)]|jgi:hypothetical protein|uniref:hypothetical protein n=1 Tax=Bosea sp. (in: a-proteobacteria) TaxID=1871050 RepID=UPI00356561A7